MNDPAASALPDFCRLPRIAAVCGVAQLAVVLVFLSPNQSHLGSWQGFLFVSAFAQWLALAALALLILMKFVVGGRMVVVTGLVQLATIIGSTAMGFAIG